MEKFSAFRDPGTGIQPFLTPVPPVSSDIVASILLPFGYVIGVVKTTLVVFVGLLYVVVVHGICAAVTPLGPLHRILTRFFAAVFARLTLLLVGVWWIPVEVVTRKRGRGAKGPESWSPGAGDVIVCNWASWIELLWLAFRFDPIFVLPVCTPVELTPQASSGSTPISRTPGRRTGTGSAAISSPSTRAPTPRADVRGFRRVSLLGMLAATGAVPSPHESCVSLEEIRRDADRPVVVFPEGTTSNGRGLLRFANVFKGVEVPVKDFRVFVMCVRYDPPTPLTPTLSRSIASSTLNPLAHIFKLTTAFVPLTLSIRLLAPSESPSSGSFVVSEVVTTGKTEDMLSEACASLIAQIGKMKRVGMGWEDKAAFLEFYRAKRK